jgi:NADH-quinone oxidoreductase subunit N
MLALPEIFLAAAGLALLMLGVFLRGNSTERIAWLSVLVLVMTGALLLWPTIQAAMNPFISAPRPALAFGGLYVVDQFAVFLKSLVLLGSALTIIMSLDYIARENMRRFEFPILLLFATLGMMMMLSANNLIALYVGLELQSLALYVVAAFQRDSERSTEAGLKYFVLGALSSGMLLYGASMVYGFAGTTSFAGLATAFAGTHGPIAIGLIVGLVFVIAGLAFKVSAVPFHMWTPDVYEGAPTPATAFLAAAPKLAAIGLFMRVMVGPFHQLHGEWLQIIWFISVASMILGAVAAVAQTNIKRLMAYSSIGNMGYALVGLAPGTPEGIRGVLVYVAIYLFMTLGTFGCILLMRQKGKLVEGIYDLAGLSRTNPPMAAALAVFMFSLAGVPPLAGFFGKFYVFYAAVQTGLIWLAIIGFVTSVVSAFYYLRIVKVMYFDEPVASFDRSPGWSMNAIIAGSGLLVLLFLVFAGPVLDAAQAAAASLFPS